MLEKLNRLVRIFCGVGLGINVVYTTSGAWRYPVAHVDAWSIWLLKAKWLYTCPDQWFQILHKPDLVFSHPEYPLGLPWLMSLVYRLLGGVREQYLSLLYPLLYLGVLGLVYLVLKKLVNQPTWRWLLLYSYSMLPPLLAQAGRYHAGLADIVVAALGWGILTSLLYKPKNWWLPLGLVLIATQVKTEAFLLVLWLIVAKWPLSKKLAVGLASLSLVPIWWYARTMWAFPVSYQMTFYSLPVLWHRLIMMGQDVGRELFLNLNNWYIFWYLFVVTLVLGKPRPHFLIPRLKLINLGWIVTILGVYLTSSIPIEGYVVSTLDRLLLQWSPAWFSLWVLYAQSYWTKSDW